MCGFSGIVSENQRQAGDWLLAARHSLHHRGPDSSGEWFSDDLAVSLSHNRLAIIDLSDAAAQPLERKDLNVVITFNGEIYNHHILRKELRSLGYGFKSRSDTEVIIVAYKHWGLDFVKHLEGMFSFCLYDVLEELVILARDRAGEKTTLLLSR